MSTKFYVSFYSKCFTQWAADLARILFIGCLYASIIWFIQVHVFGIRVSAKTVQPQVVRTWSLCLPVRVVCDGECWVHCALGRKVGRRWLINNKVCFVFMGKENND